MSAILSAVKRHFDSDCFAKKCHKVGCTVSLKGIPAHHKIIDLDKSLARSSIGDPRCDYLLVADGNGEPAWIVPMELKRGKLRAKEVVKQLRAGASAAACLVSQEIPFRLCPVAVTGYAHRSERDKLKDERNLITLKGCTTAALQMECGGKLVETLRKWK